MAGAVLSKSRYLSGLQCPKKLWTEVHARQRIPAVDPATQARFDQGHDVGSVARGLYPGGLEIGPGVRRWDRVVADTERALTQRRPLYEAAFRSGGAACRVDIMAPVGTDQWDVLEVKSSTGVKEVHLVDLALQSFVLQGTGLRIRDYFLVHLDTSYSRSGDLDLQALFHRQRVTDEVAERGQNVASDLERMQQVLGSDSCPEIGIGKHCNEPYGCALKPECWAFLPPSNVFDLTRGKQRGFEFLARGIEDLKDIPLTSDLTVEQRIQLEAVRQGEPHVDNKALRAFLTRVSYPTSYFDIETLGPGIPLFDKSRPYEQIPFLFSIHRIEGPGQRARHFAYMYGGQEDPRPDFLRAARTALGNSGSIVAYNASFEKRILRESAASVLPELEDWAVGLEDRFVDLLAPFQKFAYHHPDQRGSASLKRVLPPLTGMSYADLEIADGSTASSEYLRVISTKVGGIERAEVLRQLEDYCSLDTLGMVELVEKLADLSAE